MWQSAIMNVKLYPNRIPTEEGYYLFQGAYSSVCDLLHVVEFKSAYGGTYLGVAGYRGRNVEALKGSFSEKLKFI